MNAGRCVFVSVSLAVAVVLGSASGQCPEQINYQGRLLDGTNLVNGAVSLVLSLYDSATGGTMLYRCSNDVVAVDGLYTAWIGSNTLSGTLTNALRAGSVYLDIIANSQGLSPRERLLSVPYSLYSGVASQALWAAGAQTALTLQQLPDLSNVIWVAERGMPGNPGTYDKPIYPPQAGYDFAAGKYAGTWATLIIAGGVYTNGILMHAGNVHVIGLARPVLNGLTNLSNALPTYPGKQRVEGLVFTNRVTVLGCGIKFRDCRVVDATTEVGGSVVQDKMASDVEFQHCRFYCAEQAAMWVLPSSTTVGVYHCSLESKIRQQIPGPQPGPFGGTLIVQHGVTNLEVIGCEILSTYEDPRARVPAVMDWEVSDKSMVPDERDPSHLYAYNYMKGPLNTTKQEQQGGQILNGLTFWDPQPATQTVVFVHNTVWGDVGANGNRQFHMNNSVYGLINAGGFAGVGWTQAGVGSGHDAQGNVEHQTTIPRMPDAWKD